jgi:hypothetical protein
VPFLRFTRDTRGYENTFLMRVRAVRGRKRARVLYWFRTPPGVRVGRSPLDQEAIRMLEAAHPDIRFDWTAILQNKTVSEPAPPSRPSKREKQPQRGAQAAPADDMRAASAQPDSSAVVSAATPLDDRADVPGRIDALDRAERLAGPAHVPIVERHPALEELVGAEGVARLRARAAEMRTRISEVADASLREALAAEAEALDPDTWVTIDEARAGLERFEAGFEVLRRKLPPVPGRRSRRGAGPSNAPTVPDPAAVPEAVQPPRHALSDYDLAPTIPAGRPRDEDV